MTSGPFLQRRSSHLAEVAGVHRGLADGGGGQRRGARDRVLHDPVESPLPDLAEQEAAQEAPLRAVRPREELAQGTVLPIGRARPLVARDRFERAVHVGEGEGLARGISVGRRGLDRSPAHSDPSLGQGPRQVERRELGLLPARLPEELRDEGGLLELPGRGPDLLDELDEPSQLHVPSPEEDYYQNSEDTFAKGRRYVSCSVWTELSSRSLHITADFSDREWRAIVSRP